MIVSDCSPAFPALAQKLEDEYVRLDTIFREWHADPDRSDRDCNLILYLMRRASRPIHAVLREEYIKLWGKKASFSYFFPEHTTNAIWHRAMIRMRNQS